MSEKEADRRREPRVLTCYPIHYEKSSSNGSARIALIHDLSITGALLLTRGKVEPGEHVKLHLDVFGEPEKVSVAAGHVLRCDRRDPEVSDMWGFSVGVQFERAMPELEASIQELAKKALGPVSRPRS